MRDDYMRNLEFLQKFRPDVNTIKEFEHWIVCIRAKQVTIGAAIIALKRQCPSIGEMTEEEAIEYPKVIKWYEELCKDKFGAVRFNYMAVMMKDCIVHYHAFPRYDKEIELFDLTWKDFDWPYVVNIRVGDPYDQEILAKVIKYMQDEKQG